MTRETEAVEPSWRDRIDPVWAGIVAGGIALALVVFIVTRVIDPAPPRTITMATGSAGGAYAAAGEAIAARLAADGVTVELRATAGSVDNLDLLTRAEDGVDIAVVQGGLGQGAEDLASLGGLFYEPLWVFARAGAPLSDLRDLAGLRLAAGAAGSGTRALVSSLLADNGLTDADINLLDASGSDALAAVRAGRADAAALVTTPDRAFIAAAIADPGLRVLSFDRAEAYARRHRYLSRVTLPRGVMDLGADRPAEDVTLVAAAASLVVREDLHPALQVLLLEAMTDAYRAGDVIAPPGVFPSRDFVSFPLTSQAERYYERGGPNFLRRYLPFWAANMIERLWVLAIPLLTLLYPLVKSAPPLYRWRIRRSITRWYRDLRELESDSKAAASDTERNAIRAQLADMLEDVRELAVPLPYNDDVYRLRSHIRFVDQLVLEAYDAPPVTARRLSSHSDDA